MSWKNALSFIKFEYSVLIKYYYLKISKLKKECFMKVLALFLTVLLISSTSVLGQQQGISIGGNVHFPVGEWSDAQT